MDIKILCISDKKTQSVEAHIAKFSSTASQKARHWWILYVLSSWS